MQADTELKNTGLTNTGFKQDLSKYITGFVLSIILTIGAFVAILYLSLPQALAMLVAGVLGVVQLTVQLKYFLHIDTGQESRDKLHLLLFSMLILLIIVIGTVWIMADLDGRMMHSM